MRTSFAIDGTCFRVNHVAHIGVRLARRSRHLGVMVCRRHSNKTEIAAEITQLKRPSSHRRSIVLGYLDMFSGLVVLSLSPMNPLPLAHHGYVHYFLTDLSVSRSRSPVLGFHPISQAPPIGGFHQEKSLCRVVVKTRGSDGSPGQ